MTLHEFRLPRYELLSPEESEAKMEIWDEVCGDSNGVFGQVVMGNSDGMTSIFFAKFLKEKHCAHEPKTTDYPWTPKP